MSDRLISNMLNLTRNQKAALTTLNSSVSVSAGAGSGKTEVLVQRFCHIVERGRACVDEILTVTFTEKAAMEMKERIARRLTSLRREAGLQAVESAYIGTIHAFCRRVLVENILEAGVDPHFTILSDAEGSSLANLVLSETLQARQSDPHVARLLRDLGDKMLADALLSLYGRIRSLGHKPSNDMVAQIADPEPFLETFDRCVEALMGMGEAVDDAPAELLGEIASGLAEARASAKRLLSSGNGAGFKWEDLLRLKEYHARFTAFRGPREIRQQVRATREALGSFVAACLDSESASSARIMLDLLADFGARFRREKDRLGALDYDDLLHKTRKLLLEDDGQPTETAVRYRDKFKFIILDEFQDTNRLQKLIVDAVSRPDNVFTVGDAKQSIFSFMYSDVDIFRDYHRRAEARRAKIIPLHENFRSREGIIGFVNWFFGEVWAEEPDFEFEWLRSAGRFAAKDAPDTEVILVPRCAPGSEERRSIEQGRRNEATAIARRILELTQPGEGAIVHTKEGRAGRPITPGDIVILLRSTTQLRIYERTLEEHGIDTYVVSGRGFYSTREVQDVVNLLRVADNPLNDMSMAAVLRSPFVGISEDALFWLCRDWPAQGGGRQDMPPPDERPGKLWRGIGRLAENPHLADSDRAKLASFAEMLSDLLGIRYRPRITDILDLALDRSEFQTRLLTMRSGRRKYANIRKLYEVTQEFQASRLFGLSDFITYVRELERLAERETEVPTESEGDAVRIMTIHKAKGLQAPVVFVADMSRNLEPSPGLLAFDQEWGLAVQVRNPLDLEIEASLAYLEVSERLRFRAMSEEKRLLYVAMTRAEEHLILVGCSDLKGDYRSTYMETRTWTEWLEKALQLGPKSAEGEIQGRGFRALFRRGVPERPPTRLNSGPQTLSAQFGRELLEGKRIEGLEISPNAAEAAGRAVGRCLADASPRAGQVPRISVSQMLDYLECPARYRVSHLLGMRESETEGSGRGFSAADLGHMVHAILEEVDFSADVRKQLRASASAIADESLRAEVQPLLERFVSSRWYRELGTCSRMVRESPFELLVGDTVLAGRMDVLYCGDDGWTVLDYKTGAAEDRERYELQVGVYAYATHRLLGEMPARGALLLLSVGEEWVQDTSDGALARLAAGKVRSVVQEIAAGRFDPHPGKWCEWCPIRAGCPDAPGDIIPQS